MKLATMALLVCAFQADARGARVEQLTDSERATRRFDPAAAAARRAQAVADGLIAGNPTGKVIAGNRNPELLMRVELIDYLAGALGDPTSIAKYQEKWLARGVVGYLGGDFLNRLRLVAGTYVDAEAQIRALRTQRSAGSEEENPALGAELRRVNDSLCQLRADVLAAGRTTFGRDTFERFLYEVVAPDVLIFTGSSGSSPDTTLELWLDGGCQ